jgi:pimeloyl-ACP methyl ester carboxylesterase
MLTNLSAKAAVVASECFRLEVRGLEYNIRRWGCPDARPLLCLHGLKDCSVTFQFLVDHLQGEWCVFAPDWRGHGDTDWTTGNYWLHEYVADLDVLTGKLFGGQAIPAIGHSLGGNVAGIFAGLRPRRLSHLVSLDGLGPLVHVAEVNVAEQLSDYLDGLYASRGRKTHDSVSQAASKLMSANRRLSEARATFLAEHSLIHDADGSWRWKFDPNNKASLPTLRSIGEWKEIWSRIEVPALWLASGDKRRGNPVNEPGEIERRMAANPAIVFKNIPDTGHNLHHDRPEEVAREIEIFLTETA